MSSHFKEKVVATIEKLTPHRKSKATVPVGTSETSADTKWGATDAPRHTETAATPDSVPPAAAAMAPSAAAGSFPAAGATAATPAAGTAAAGPAAAGRTTSSVAAERVGAGGVAAAPAEGATLQDVPGKVIDVETFTRTEDHERLVERKRYELEHHPVRKEYVVETKYVGEHEIPGAATEVVGRESRVVAEEVKEAPSGDRVLLVEGVDLPPGTAAGTTGFAPAPAGAGGFTGTMGGTIGRGGIGNAGGTGVPPTS